MSPARSALKVFISYSHQDDEWRRQLETQRGWSYRHRRVLLSGVVSLAALFSMVAYGAFSWSSSMAAQGQRDLRVGAYDAAEKQFWGAVAANPFDRRARRGLRLARLGLMIPDLENMTDDFARHVVQLERGAAHVRQGLLFVGDRFLDVYRRSGDPRKLTAASEAYGQAVKRDPAFSEAHARLAHVHLLHGDLPAAAEQLRQAIEASEEDRKSTRLNSSHLGISYAVVCL